MTTIKTTSLIAVAWAALALGCVENVCDSDSDCSRGWQCDPASSRCVAVDAGDASDAGDAGDAGDGGDAEPGCTESSECTTPSAPICDELAHQCRGCESSPECVARDPARPVCAGPACVECSDSATDCTNPSPICEGSSGDCRGCVSDGECASRDPQTPACDGSSCVECTDSAQHCGGNTPVCDGPSATCRACASHGECDFAGGVCDWSSGACLAESEVIYVDDDTCPGVGDGGRASPYCALQDGVDAVSPGLTTVFVFDGTYGRIDVMDVDPLWIVGESPLAHILELSLSAQVYIGGTSNVTLEGLTIGGAGSSGVGVECDGNITTHPTVVLSGNTISGNSGGGVSATSCTATLSGNTISGNSGGGVSLTSSDFMVMNNIIALNGSGTSSYGGATIFMPGATAELWHNTVVDNLIGSTDPAGIWCVSAVTVHATLSYGNDNADLSVSCVPSFCWTTADGDPQLDGTYHLQPGSGCIDGGDPAGTLSTDIDGEPRPQGGGPDIGADEAQ